MKKLLVIFGMVGAFSLVSMSPWTVEAKGKVSKSSCSYKGKKLYGKIKIVKNFPDIKVKIVKSFPDLKVKKVKNFPDKCGKWKIVKNFPDLKVKIVKNFPDIKVKYVKNFPGVP